jgi:hypothetical protein
VVCFSEGYAVTANIYTHYWPASGHQKANPQKEGFMTFDITHSKYLVFMLSMGLEELIM